MPGAQPLEETRITRAPALLRSRVLLTIGWTLLLLSLALFAFHMLWMWKRMAAGAPMVAVGLGMDALVGLGLIIAGVRARRMQ